MRIFLTVLILIFSLQSWTKADDISDFEIEGISIGDSALDYYSKGYLDSFKKNYYPKSKKFYFIAGIDKGLESYGYLQFHLKNNDKKYIVYSVSGMTDYKENINDCYILKKTLITQIKSLFPNSEVLKDKKQKHAADKSGKSFIDTHDFILDSGAKSHVSCSDWHDTMPWVDKLTVSIISKELRFFINNEAY